VCSDAASLPEVAGDATLLVDARQPEALRDALARVVEDTALAADLRARGTARARELSWPRAARELRALYRDVAGF
jgi:glycosyltransferase involved in cell wall biosynthesis